MSTIGNSIHELGATAREVAADQIEAIQECASDMLDHGRQRIRNVGQSVESRLHAQPMKTVLVAVGVGILLGMIFSRRS
jgi:ElaB/YqjD/DUF883 family membrane-anchored ribosome-binding protein